MRHYIIQITAAPEADNHDITVEVIRHGDVIGSATAALVPALEMAQVIISENLEADPL